MTDIESLRDACVLEYNQQMNKLFDMYITGEDAEDIRKSIRDDQSGYCSKYYATLYFHEQFILLDFGYTVALQLIASKTHHISNTSNKSPANVIDKAYRAVRDQLFNFHIRGPGAQELLHAIKMEETGQYSEYYALKYFPDQYRKINAVTSDAFNKIFSVC